MLQLHSLHAMLVDCVSGKGGWGGGSWWGLLWFDLSLSYAVKVIGIACAGTAVQTSRRRGGGVVLYVLLVDSVYYDTMIL